jgi:hypothetical protein
MTQEQPSEQKNAKRVATNKEEMKQIDEKRKPGPNKMHEKIASKKKILD